MLKDEWLTPPAVIMRLGPFDLDPCAPIVRPWPTANKHFTVEDDGLAQPWSGFVWCNPPYGSQTGVWLDRMAEHRNGIALIFARTETDDFFQFVWSKADGILFHRGRFHFHHVDGRRAGANSGAPSVFIAYGPEAVSRLRTSGLPGVFTDSWSEPVYEPDVEALL